MVCMSLDLYVNCQVVKSQRTMSFILYNPGAYTAGAYIAQWRGLFVNDNSSFRFPAVLLRDKSGAVHLMRCRFVIKPI